MQLVRRNPGIPVVRLRGVIGKEMGLSRKTVIEDLKTLQAAGSIYERNFRVYAR